MSTICLRLQTQAALVHLSHSLIYESMQQSTYMQFVLITIILLCFSTIVRVVKIFLVFHITN